MEFTKIVEPYENGYLGYVTIKGDTDPSHIWGVKGKDMFKIHRALERTMFLIKKFGVNYNGNSID